MKLGLTSTEFVIILPIVIFLYYVVPCRIRQLFLLLINLLFYFSFGITGIITVGVEGLIVWGYAKVQTKGRKKFDKVLLVVTIITLVSIILAFRLLVRINDSIVAPMGLSFYTLGAISYVIDIYKNKIEPEDSFIKLLTWLSFFPIITSGPIYRFNDFKKEYDRNSKSLCANYSNITKGIIYMIYGYFLKLVIAERVAVAVNTGFDYLGNMYLNFIALITIAVLYSIQIYADFAGYSAIVIGMSQIIGFSVPENFKAPYLSESVKEFWGRWHISLSTWLRDYVYIPLGGNKKGKFRKYFNVLFTFIVSGLWHGFGLHYLAWGLLHAGYQILEDIFTKPWKQMMKAIRFDRNVFIMRVAGRLRTFVAVTIAWLFFRTGINDAIYFIKEIFTATRIDEESLDLLVYGMGISIQGWIILLLSVAVMIFVDALMFKNMRIDRYISDRNVFVRVPIIIVALLTILIFGIYGDQHDASYFIYRYF